MRTWRLLRSSSVAAAPSRADEGESEREGKDKDVSEVVEVSG